MSELERELSRLASHVDFPPAPDLTALLGRAAPAPARRRQRRRWRAVLVAAMLTVLAAGTVTAWVTLRGVAIRRVERLPRTPQTASLDLGRRLPAVAAAEGTGFHMLVPAALGSPDALYRKGGRISLLYRPRGGLRRSPHSGVGALITELRADLPAPLIQKLVSTTATAMRFTLDGHPAVWIGGPAHAVVYARNGRPEQETLRLAGNVLLLDRGSVLVRIEAEVDRATAVRIARSLR